MDHGKKVWAPDLRDGFILGEISDFGTDTIDVQPLNGGKVIAAPYDAVYPAEEDDDKDAEDNCALPRWLRAQSSQTFPSAWSLGVRGGELREHGPGLSGATLPRHGPPR